MNCVYRSACTLEEARELYPDWYQRRIVQHEARGHFQRYQPIYYNWIDKILEGAVVGTRYNCLENLYSLAVQCNIDPVQVEKDCRRVAVRFEEMTETEDNHFTEYDILCALKTYHTASEQAYRRKIEYISKKTGIKLIPNKRNGRKQSEHIKLMNFVRDEINGNKCWRNIKGRPTVEQIVREWKESHPEGKKAECIRETGLAKMTVYKWWNIGEKDENNQADR